MDKAEELQAQLNRCYDLIVSIANKSGILRWRDQAVPYLSQTATIKPMPWWFPTGWGKRTIATTVSAKKIYLTARWYQLAIQDRARTLLHEAIHVKHYHEGDLTWFKYLSDPGVRWELEFEGGEEGRLWLETWEIHR